MFARTPDPIDQPLEDAIDRLLKFMDDQEPDSKEYANALKQLQKLYALKPEKLERVQPDTLIKAGSALLGIGIIVIYEQKHVLTSRAMQIIKFAM